MLRWRELIHCSDEILALLDVAEVNLACAADFPDAPSEADVVECLSRLDQIAKAVPAYQDRCLPDFYLNPGTYYNSVNVFRMVSLLRVVLKFGVRYNPAKKPVDAPFETADMFIHGAMLGEGGTCASLPMVYAAVARRLGYPIKLVNTTRHLFCRWDDPDGERFNLEANDTGISMPPDEHYAQGIYAAPDRIFRKGCFLRSQTPRQELSGFLTQRGCRWLDLHSPHQAYEALISASGLDPYNLLLRQSANYVLDKSGTLERNHSVSVGGIIRV